VQKPSRSDEVLEAQQQWQMTEQTKSHFEALAPIRHRKPLRSDNSDDVEEVEDEQCDDIPPEFKKYQELESLSQPSFASEDGESSKEFVETDYYKDFNGINELHHTTGDGFIKLDCNGGRISVWVTRRRRMDQWNGSPFTATQQPTTGFLLL